MRRHFLAFLLLLSAAAPARAVFVKTQMDRIDPEPLFDSEYFSDLLAFSYPAQWDDLWAGSTTAYRVNGASLDCCDLLLQQELKFKRRLVDGLDFKFRLVQQDDKDRQELHTWLELEKKLGAGFSASLFGEPTFHKEDSDIGLGLRWSPNDSLSLAARHAFVDFDFNKRGSTAQRYSRKPSTDELALEARRGAHAFAAALELDHPLRREVPAENRVFSYRRTTASVGWRHRPAGGLDKRVGYSYEFEKKGNLFNPDPLDASLSYQRQLHTVTAAVEGRPGPKDSLELGQVLMVRTARDDDPHNANAGVFYRRWEAQPYARWRREVKDWLTTELMPLLSLGEDLRRRPGEAPPSSFNAVVEAKLGAGLDFVFSRSGRIALFATFDLDEPANHPWDGGSVRALFLF